ncbi:MAG: TIGR04552 family protein [Polyangiaceae bacterium]|nr:TIGR04552 family protein [Polyangiaceae bacterium]
MDLATVWLILTGNSVIDWQRVDFRSPAEARAFLRAQAFDLDARADVERLEAIKSSAIEYLRRQFDFPIPRPIEQATVEELLVIASGKGHRQLAACVVLKAMHIIHHVEARELLYGLPMSDQDVFRLVEEKVYRVVGHMLSAGQPITEFVSGRKRRDSIYTKLLSKSETHASAIYDKLRFRIVTRSREDLLPVLLYLSQELFPFNYVVPHESINTLIHFRSAAEELPAFKVLAKRFSSVDELTLSSNTFSSQAYRILHFVVDMPVRVPKNALLAAPPAVRSLGPVIFALCEFQMVDRVTEESNEGGEASHASYKERQRIAVMQRLKLGS